MVSNDPIYDDQKNASGGLASIAWLLSCAYLYFTAPNGTHLFSLFGLGFVIIGMFVAAILIGIVFYIVQRIVGKIAILVGAKPNSTWRTILWLVGFALMAAQILATFILANWAFNLIFSGGA